MIQINTKSLWCKYISYFSKFCNGSETSCKCQIPFEKPFDHNSDPHSLFIFRPLDFYAPLNISHGWLNPLLSYFIADFTFYYFFQPHCSVKWRLALLAASFSMILSVASASEDVKASSRSAFHRGNNLKKALKTESENHLGNPRTVNPNDPKTIDYTLYNYGKSFFLLENHT